MSRGHGAMTVPMSELFHRVSRRFANDIDRAIGSGNYVRGDLFVALADGAIPAGGYVLDYGCGPGRLGLLLARRGFKVRGLDISEGMLNEARTLDAAGLQIEFDLIVKLADALPPNTFDGIVCSSVIEYVANVDELLQGFHRSLRKSGVLIISYANASSYFRRRSARGVGENPMGPAQHHTWDWAGFSALLQRSGFQTFTQPKFYESPWDRRPWGPWFRGSPYVGSLGVIAARPIGSVEGDREGRT